MSLRSKLHVAVLALALLPACTPRRPVVLPPPPPPPPAEPVLTDAQLEMQKDLDAHRLWQEGTAYGRRGDWRQAEASFRGAASTRPDSATYHQALATALLQQGKTWEAADAMQLAIRAAEARRPVNHRVLAVDYDRLIQLLDRLNRLDEARVARDRQRFHRMMRDSQQPER